MHAMCNRMYPSTCTGRCVEGMVCKRGREQVAYCPDGCMCMLPEDEINVEEDMDTNKENFLKTRREHVKKTWYRKE